eukprot:8212277-Alexandrium_andersonii.AAC.1
MARTAAPRAVPAPDTGAAPGCTNSHASKRDVCHWMSTQVWACDVCHRMSTQVKNRLRFRCNECDYDLCDECHRNGFKAA